MATDRRLPGARGRYQKGPWPARINAVSREGRTVGVHLTIQGPTRVAGKAVVLTLSVPDCLWLELSLQDARVTLLSRAAVERDGDEHEPDDGRVER